MQIRNAGESENEAFLKSGSKPSEIPGKIWESGHRWTLETEDYLSIISLGLDRPPLCSPRLIRLAQEYARDSAAIGAFWCEVDGELPLIEAIPGDEQFAAITFIYRGNEETKRVVLRGGQISDAWDKPLLRFSDTELWYRSERIQKDARFTYSFSVTSLDVECRELDPRASLLTTQTADPLNPGRYMGESVVELPGAPAQPWLEPSPGIPGQLLASSIRSEILNENREFYVYTPPGWKLNGGSCGLLILFDGQERRETDLTAYGFPSHIILDNLIASRRIPPLIAVLIDNANTETRHRDLSCSEPFLKFVADELVPWVRIKYQASADPRDVIVCGASKGGLCSVWFGFKRPDVFGNVLAQSGSFWWPGWRAGDSERHRLTRSIASAPRSEARFFIEAGRFEGAQTGYILFETRHLRDVLTAKGYDVFYSEFSGDHGPINWRGSFADGLICLTSRRNLDRPAAG